MWHPHHDLQFSPACQEARPLPRVLSGAHRLQPFVPHQLPPSPYDTASCPSLSESPH